MKKYLNIVLVSMVLVLFAGCHSSSPPPNSEIEPIPIEEKENGANITGEDLLIDNSVENILKYTEKISQWEGDQDNDGDGLTNAFEQKILKLMTLPDIADTDKNGISDANEDLDNDGLTNIVEQEKGTNPLHQDTDNDGIKDSDELNITFTDPLNADTDGDGLIDGDELVVGTKPLDEDSDADGILDGNETFTTTKVDESGIILEITGKGNLAKQVVINKSVPATGDVESNIPGLIGAIMNLDSDANVTEAKLKIPITQEMLDSVNGDVSKLRIAYIDDKSKEITFPQPQGISQDEKFIWIELNHFSSYMVVNIDMFNKSFDEEFYGSTRTGTGGLDLILAIDSSGSMRGNDSFNLRISASPLCQDSCPKLMI